MSEDSATGVPKAAIHESLISIFRVIFSCVTKLVFGSLEAKMSDIPAKRRRGRPTKGQTAMSAIDRQAARRRRIREAEATLLEAREAAQMLDKWTDMMQHSLRHGQTWQVEQSARELRSAAVALHRILC